MASMKYVINQFLLDTDNRTLTIGDKEHAIRPRTLALLVHLLERQEQIISKQTLLDEVWDDVQVNEGVVFQSVREIRQLFDENKIIQNYPRKGYQLNADVSPVESSPEKPKQHTRSHLILSLFGLCIVLLVGLFSWHWTQQPRTLSQLDFEDRLLVMPVSHQLGVGENQWLKLGGMELLIAKLNGISNSHFVYPSDAVQQAIKVTNVSNRINQFDRDKLFEISGANHILETQVIGDVYDFSLVFKLHQPDKTHSGIVPAPTIIEGLTSVAENVALQMGAQLSSQKTLVEDYSDSAFIEAISVYEQDWASAIPLFEQYLVNHPQSLLALRYLTKLYLWKGLIGDAETLVEQSKHLAFGNNVELAYALFNQALVAEVNGQFKRGLIHLEEAETQLVNEKEWLLKSRIAETRGHLYKAIDDVQTAISHYQQALTFNQLIQSPIGITTMELHLSDALLESGNKPEAMALFELAKQRIEEQNLLFLYSMLADFEQRMKRGNM